MYSVRSITCTVNKSVQDFKVCIGVRCTRVYRSARECIGVYNVQECTVCVGKCTVYMSVQCARVRASTSCTSGVKNNSSSAEL